MNKALSRITQFVAGKLARAGVVTGLLLMATATIAATPPPLAIVHVTVIDATGTPAQPDRVVIVEQGHIRAIGDPARIALPAGAQLIIDTQRLWHAATHLGTEPRYCLITSWESGPELDAYIEKYHGVNHVESVPISQETLDAGQAEQARRDAARAAYYAAKGQAELAAQTAMSEA